MTQKMHNEIVSKIRITGQTSFTIFCLEIVVFQFFNVFDLLSAKQQSNLLGAELVTKMNDMHIVGIANGSCQTCCPQTIGGSPQGAPTKRNLYQANRAVT